MDPIGFAMENFDAVGKWRDRDSGHPIDASGVLPGGTTFDGMAGLKAALLAHPERFVSAVAEKLLMYALGRNLQYYDAPSVRQIVRESARSHYTFSSLVSAVVTSAPFQMRTAKVTKDIKDTKDTKDTRDTKVTTDAKDAKDTKVTEDTKEPR